MSSIAIRGKNQGSDGLVTVTKDGDKRRLDVSIDGGGALSDGGSSAIGSSNYTSKPSGINADSASAFIDSTSISITGLSFVFTKYDLKSVVQVPTSGETTVFSDINDFVVTGSIGSQTITIATGAFVASDTFTALLSGDEKAYDKTNNSKRVEDVKSTSALPIDVSITSAPTGTADYYFSMDDLKEYEIAFEKVGGTDSTTMTIYASNDPDSIDDASKAYQDIGRYGHGITTASATAATYIADARLYKVPRSTMTMVKVSVAVAGGANDADYNLTVKVQ